MDKNTTTIYEFDPCIYPRLLWVVKGGTLNGIKEILNLGDYEVDEDGSGAVTLCNVRRKSDDNLGALIWFPKSSNMNNLDWIAHESTHAALYVFAEVGADVDFENQEPFAYIVGWVFGCVDKVRKNNSSNQQNLNIITIEKE
jgi:hypothetical protein